MRPMYNPLRLRDRNKANHKSQITSLINIILFGGRFFYRDTCCQDLLFWTMDCWSLGQRAGTILYTITTGLGVTLIAPMPSISAILGVILLAVINPLLE